MPTDTDEEVLESSTSEQPADEGTPAVESAPEDDGGTPAPAGEGEDTGTQDAQTAVGDEKEPASKEGKFDPVEAAIAHLSIEGKRKRDKQEKGKEAVEGEAAAAADDKATKGKGDAAAQAAAKATEKPALADLTAEERAAMSEKSRKRWDQVFAERKSLNDEVTPYRALAAELKVKPEELPKYVKSGHAFRSVVDNFKLSDDLNVIQDQEAAGALKFQASIARLGKGKGTAEDLARCEMVFKDLDKDREFLGIPWPKQGPDVDVDALTKAIDAAENDFDFTAVRKLVGELKAAKDAIGKPQQQAAPVQQPAPQARVQIQQPAPQQIEQPQHRVDPDEMLYERECIGRVVQDGIKNPKDYFENQLFPLIVNDRLKISYPKADPMQAFSQLSARARRDLTIEAHEKLQKQAEAITPSAGKPRTNGGRPLAASAGKPAWANQRQQATGAEAAINFLAAPE